MTKESYIKDKVNPVRNFFTMFAFTLMVFALTPMTAYARADRPNAVADIMNDERFTGAIDSISWLTGRIDHWFTIVISVTAFFIISSALLKNVCAGAYCANHKFWDKVAEAHEHNEATTLASLVQGVKGIPQMTAGGVKEAILCIVPNIKAFTDFDDADIEPRQYFSKAIPQMLLCVMIGVFIYNGYYRDTASMVGSMGSEICVRVFASVDPATFLDKITQTSKTPPNIFSEDPSLQGKDAYELSMDIYKACLSSTPEASYEDKENIMRNSENTAANILNDSDIAKFYEVGRMYDYRIGSVKVVLIPPKAATRPVVKNTDGAAQTKYAVVTYQDTVAPTIARTDNDTMYISFTISGAAKSSNRSMISEIKAAAGSGQGIDASTVTDAWTLDVTKHSTLSSMWDTKDNKMTFTGKNVTPDVVGAALAQAAGKNDINALMTDVLNHNKNSNTKTITLTSVKMSGSNTTVEGSMSGDISSAVRFSAEVQFKYTTGDSDEERQGSMEYVMNVTFAHGTAEVVPDLSAKTYQAPVETTDGGSPAISGNTVPNEA